MNIHGKHSISLERRLLEHNQGKVKSSKPYRPYEVLHQEELKSLVEAKNRENFYKSTSGRKFLRNFVKKWKESKI